MHLSHFYDSAAPENIPTGVQAGAYVDGYAWSAAEVRRMSRVFRITVTGSTRYAHIARCIDVENGAATWREAVAYCKARHEATGRHDFTLYASLSPMEDFDGQGRSAPRVFRDECPGLPFRLWVAEWDGNASNRPVVDGVEAWAKQYENTAGWDLSALYGVNDLIPTH